MQFPIIASLSHLDFLQGLPTSCARTGNLICQRFAIENENFSSKYGNFVAVCLCTLLAQRFVCRFDTATTFKTGSTLLLPVFESDIERNRAILQGRELPPLLPSGGRGAVAAVVEFSNKGGINAAEGFGDVDLVVAKSVARRYGYVLDVPCVQFVCC